jgi:hypothetical protein
MEMNTFMSFYRFYRRCGMRSMEALRKAGQALKH